MEVEILTKQDLEDFRAKLLTDLMLLLSAKEQAPAAEKKWLRSHEVKKMLSISTGTLQNLGMSGTLHPKKIGGIISIVMRRLKNYCAMGRNDCAAC